jgi:serine/threonine-protein kinase
MSTKVPEKSGPVDVREGTVINGKFRLLTLVATGGMGRVYRAEQAPLGRIVAIKVLRTPGTGSDTIASEFRKRFFREASILSKLQHANIVTLFDYGHIEGLPDDRYFMAMEYLGGGTLAERLKRGPLSVQESLRTLRQIARGLREAHKLGAVHRDLKPSNVMLVPEEDGAEVVKVLDFGIGKMMGDDDNQELTQEGAFLGSPKYIAPEQVNERRVDARTDVYALGVIAFECLTGVVPFEGETNLETILAHTNRPLPAMSQRSPGVMVPDVVERFVRRCLEKEPADRPQSMEEVLRAISECEQVLFGSVSLGAVPADVPPVSTARITMQRRDRASDVGTLALHPSAVQRASGHPAAMAPGATASPLTRSPSTMPPPQTKSQAPLVALIIVSLLGTAGLVLARWGGYLGHPPARASATPTAAASPALMPAARSFTLVLDSNPPGADVSEGDDVLGATPVQVTIDRASVKDAPRRFVLRHEGYAAYTVLQGDADGVVVITAPLEATAAAPSASAAPSATAHAPRWTPPRGTSNQRPQQDLDIKLQR